MRAVHALWAGIAVVWLAGPVLGKSVHQIQGPAETPPASYKSRQYVDSKGCVFIRAGSGSQINWVPRVTRSRQVICGQKPTGVSGSTRFAAPSKSVPTLDFSTPVTATATTKPQAVQTTAPRRQTNFWNWFQTPARTRTVVTKPAPQVRTVVATPQAVVTPRVAASATGPVVLPIGSGGLAIRKGPQAVHPGTFGRVQTAMAPSGVQAQTILVTRAAPVVPTNYRPLYTPEQVIGRRGVGTAQGQAAMDLIWTDTVPRRLIDARTGRDVTGVVPVQYPYVTGSSSNYTPVATTTRRKYVPAAEPVDEAAPVNMTELPSNVTAVSAGIETKTVVAVDEDAKSYQPPSLRYVQVATFGVPDNAKRTLARFDASGMPTHSRPLHRGGKAYEIVLLGPFQSDSELQAAKKSARGAGFRDAFLVN